MYQKGWKSLIENYGESLLKFIQFTIISKGIENARCSLTALHDRTLVIAFRIICLYHINSCLNNEIYLRVLKVAIVFTVIETKEMKYFLLSYDTIFCQSSMLSVKSFNIVIEALSKLLFIMIVINTARRKLSKSCCEMFYSFANDITYLIL